jgi:hypothetical protein
MILSWTPRTEKKDGPCGRWFTTCSTATSTRTCGSGGALTEDAPVIKPYDEKLWARLPDAITAPVAVSLDLLDALHTRWLILLRAMTPGDFDRRWTNPGFGESNLDVLLQLYAWHGRHHVAHITSLRQREGW